MAQTMKNLHLPLPEGLYIRLRKTADSTGRPATELAREAVQEWLENAERMETRENISEYAVKAAGTGDDLDPELEGAGLEYISAPGGKRGKK
jgi:predicted DNA-binding protein